MGDDFDQLVASRKHQTGSRRHTREKEASSEEDKDRFMQTAMPSASPGRADPLQVALDQADPATRAITVQHLQQTVGNSNIQRQLGKEPKMAVVQLKKPKKRIKRRAPKQAEGTRPPIDWKWWKVMVVDRVRRAAQLMAQRSPKYQLALFHTEGAASSITEALQTRKLTKKQEDVSLYFLPVGMEASLIRDRRKSSQELCTDLYKLADDLDRLVLAPSEDVEW